MPTYVVASLVLMTLSGIIADVLLLNSNIKGNVSRRRDNAILVSFGTFIATIVVIIYYVQTYTA